MRPVPIEGETAFGAVAAQAGFVELEYIKASCQGRLHELSVKVRLAGISRNAEIVFTHRHLGGAKGFDLESTDFVLQPACDGCGTDGCFQFYSEMQCRDWPWTHCSLCQ